MRLLIGSTVYSLFSVSLSRSQHLYLQPSSAMSNDVILISAGYDRTIRSWEAWSGSCSRTIHHSDSVNRLAISPDKRFLAAAGYSSVKLYDINSNDPNPVRLLLFCFIISNIGPRFSHLTATLVT